MTANTISIKQAKEDKLFYFVANVVVWRASDGRCLILKRSEREKVHPGKWAVPGGKLEWADLSPDRPTRVQGDVLDYEEAVEDLLVREAREEAGIEIARELYYINSVTFVRPDGIPVVLVKFASRYLSGEVIPEPGAFTDFAWVTAEEAREYDCILGVPEEIARAKKFFT